MKTSLSTTHYFKLFLLLCSTYESKSFTILGEMKIPLFNSRRNKRTTITRRTRSQEQSRNSSSITTEIHAKPQRLEDNADGILYVNDSCINCAACSYFAPNTFTRSSKSQHHIVYQQPAPPTSSTTNNPNNPNNQKDFINARAALAACPVSAIRTLTKGEVNHYNKIQLKKNKNDIESEISEYREDDDDWKSLGLLPTLTKEEEEISKSYGILNEPLSFPRKLHGNPYNNDNNDDHDNNVWLLGHHSSKSFGAFPYLVKGYHEQKLISVMVDVPKFTKSAIRAVTSLLPNTDTLSSSSSSPDYMFLTHVDDTAQHNEWKNEFPSMKRIFHSGDLGIHNWIGDESLQDVEILLDGTSQLERMAKTKRKMNDDDKSFSSAIGELVVFSLDGKKKCIQLDGNDDDHDDTNQLELKILDAMIDFDSDFLILHTPGHSPGSICLLHNEKRRSTNDEEEEGADEGKFATLFTGDTYAYTTRDGGHMTGFPRYGNDLKVQAATIDCIGQLSSLYDCIASGHGHIRHYGGSVIDDREGEEELKIHDANEAIDELRVYARF